MTPWAKCSSLPTPARGDDRDVHRTRDGASERAVEAVAAAVAIHAGEQDLPRPAPGRLLRPGDRVDARGLAPARNVDLPFVRVARHLLRVDGAEDGPASRTPRRRSVMSDGSATAAEFTDTLSAPAAIIVRMSATLRKPTAHAVRQMQLLAGAAGKVDRGGAVVARGRDVEEDHPRRRAPRRSAARARWDRPRRAGSRSSRP